MLWMHVDIKIWAATYVAGPRKSIHKELCLAEELGVSVETVVCQSTRIVVDDCCRRNTEPCFDDGKRYVYTLAGSHNVKAK